jgi:hypothetical protein
MHDVREERPLGELFGELTSETSALIKKEVELAKTELAEKGAAAGRQAKWIALSGALANTGLIVVAAAIVIGLGNVMSYTLAALLTGVALIASSYVLSRTTMKNLSQIEPAPRETIRTMKENKLWLQEQIR